MAGGQFTHNTATTLAAGRYMISYYSASSGTGKLQYAPDGTNYHDVTDTSKSASADIIIEIGWLDAGKWKAILTGDMVMYYAPITQSTAIGGL